MGERILMQYLPPYMQGYKELIQIMKGEQVEVDALWKALRDGMKEQFISDATEYGISRWERIMKITPKATDTLDERRFRILVRMNESLPYTYTSLSQRLSDLCGSDGYVVALNASAYTLNVKINLINKSNFVDVQELLDRIVPANLVVSLEIIYNQHFTVAAFTHAFLAGHTHEQIRNEVLGQ